MISIYELRLRYLLDRHVDPTDRRLSEFLLFDSGRSAIYFLYAFLKKQCGIENVYVNLYTTDVVHETLRQVGCTIHPLDVDPFTFFPRMNGEMDFKGRAFLQTGLFGFPSVDERVLKQVKDGGGVFVEDSCNSFGSSIGGKKAGTLGDAAVFSFRIGKALSTGGGGLKINDPQWRDRLDQQYSAVPAFPALKARMRLYRAYLDYVAFEPLVLKYFSRPLRRIQKRNAFLQRLVRGGVVDVLTSVKGDSIHRMSESEVVFASRRLAQFEDEVCKKREVSELLCDKLARYPLYIYANDRNRGEGWNCLFFPVLLQKGDPESFISHLRKRGFDATRFHHEVPQKSFPNLGRDEFPGTYTLVDRLVCIPNTTRMIGRVDRLVDAVDKYFARFSQ